MNLFLHTHKLVQYILIICLYCGFLCHGSRGHAQVLPDDYWERPTPYLTGTLPDSLLFREFGIRKFRQVQWAGHKPKSKQKAPQAIFECTFDRRGRPIHSKDSLETDEWGMVVTENLFEYRDKGQFPIITKTQNGRLRDYSNPRLTLSEQGYPLRYDHPIPVHQSGEYFREWNYDSLGHLQEFLFVNLHHPAEKEVYAYSRTGYCERIDYYYTQRDTADPEKFVRVQSADFSRSREDSPNVYIQIIRPDTEYVKQIYRWSSNLDTLIQESRTEGFRGTQIERLIYFYRPNGLIRRSELWLGDMWKPAKKRWGRVWFVDWEYEYW